MPDAEDSFDPKSIERESDEVDVCIVGGGKVFCGPNASPH